MANLPLELLERIVHDLSDDGRRDMETLRACSLVSSSLRSLAQRQLFSCVELSFLAVWGNRFIVEDPLESEGHRLLNLVTSQKSSHIAPLVKTVVAFVDEWLEGDDEREVDFPWYTSKLIGKPLSLSRLLPKLVNIRTLRIRHEQYLHRCGFDPKTLNAFCATRVTSLQISRSLEPPLKLILGNKYLRRLCIDHASDTVLISPDPGFLPEERVTLDALLVGDPPPRSWALKDPLHDYPTCPSISGGWITHPRCLIDVTQLSRLEIYRPSNFPPANIFPLCASTLKELVLYRAFERRFEVYDQSITYPDIMGYLTPSLDLSVFQSLSRLELGVAVGPHGSSLDHYFTSFGDLYASLQTIPDHSTISTIVLWIDIHPEFREEEVIGLNLSGLSEAFIVEGSESLRLVNLTYLEVVFHHAILPPPTLDTHEDLLKLKRTGVLRINYVYNPPLELVMR